MNSVIVIFPLIFCFWRSDLCFAATRRHPVIYIPGDGGSRLEARIKAEKGSPFSSSHCGLTSYWKRLWLDVYELATNSRVKCWADNAKLVYDFKEGKNKNAEGVETRVPGWGETETVEFIDPSWLAWAIGDVGNVAATLVRHMASKWGYKRGFDVRGAPYDFRFAPQSQADFFERLQTLIEETVQKTGERAVLLTHSLGGIFALRFLNSVSLAWKRRYIHAFAPMAAPWAGSAVAFNLYIAGDARGENVDPKVIREEQRSFETGVLLLPSRGLWTPSNATFVQTPSRNYSTGNYDRFFADLDYPVGKINHDYVRNATDTLIFPDVSVYCIYSRGTRTPIKFLYSNSGFSNGDQPEETFYGDGDGTVNLESLQLCRRWTRHSRARRRVDQGVGESAVVEDDDDDSEVETRIFDGVSHEGLMKDESVFRYLENVFVEKQKP